MNEIIDKIFDYYDYTKIADIGERCIDFYKHKNTLIANYFLLYTIDCREFEEDEKQIRAHLELLEKTYSKARTPEDIPMKQKIQSSFENIKEGSQVDKNTSAIYLLLFNDISNLNNYRNLVYSIEESPNYFKRYVLPFTENQVTRLKESLHRFKDKAIDEALCQIVDDEDGYFQLAAQKDLDSTYGLVVRMFSKLPFLQYKFKAEIAPEPIEKIVETSINETMMKFHELLNKENIDLEKISNLLSDYTPDEVSVNEELDKLLKEANK